LREAFLAAAMVLAPAIKVERWLEPERSQNGAVPRMHEASESISMAPKVKKGEKFINITSSPSTFHPELSILFWFYKVLGVKSSG
jgi:hypothetical protein